jgi:hypothetical protein
VWSELLELRVVRGVPISEEEDRGALGARVLKQTPDGRDYPQGTVAAVERVSLLEETSEHVHYQNYSCHGALQRVSSETTPVSVLSA